MFLKMILKMNFNFNFKDKLLAPGASIRRMTKVGLSGVGGAASDSYYSFAKMLTCAVLLPISSPSLEVRV